MWVMKHTAKGQKAEFLVIMADQADVSGATHFRTKAEKGRYVYQTLQRKAQTTQEPILQLLRDRGIEYQSFYIVNAILVKGTLEVARILAARTDVARVEGNPVIHNELPRPGPIEETASRPATVEPGITYTHAPQVWAEGFTGQNIVIASADTGVRWTHNALKPHYRGWDGQNANHNYNWHDSIHDSVGNPCGNDSQQPCDDFFHGSHTTGTAIGDDGNGNQIGMAPGAQWIGCRNMDQGNGTPARYMECMEWFLAPYPLNCTPAEGDPTKAPDITINSWGCPESEGCTVGNELQAAVEAQAAAGIQMVVAAGNSGSACSTVSDPPSFYAASYTVGALNTGTDTIAGFSSRGPVTRDGSNRIKPDISAPGTNTRSACNSSDTCYTTASGTSMATPHISGAMALLWSALPGLQHQITASRDALNNSAVFISSTQCGAAGPPNNVFGWGRIDIAAAVGTPSPTATPSPTPTATATASACGAAPSPTPSATATATGTPACLVVNGDFETGSLPPWTDTGDTSFTNVNNVNPHSGNFSLQAGPNVGDGFIDQTVPTVAGQAYDVSFWLANDDTSGQNRFGASFGTVTLVPEAVQNSFAYTQYTFTNVVPGANADLHFIFFNVPSYFYLDDVCITSSAGVSPTPNPTPTATPTATATSTIPPSPTPTASETTPPIRITPTPRPRPTAEPRP
jgi:subtilisin family serine protease